MPVSGELLLDAPTLLRRHHLVPRPVRRDVRPGMRRLAVIALEEVLDDELPVRLRRLRAACGDLTLFQPVCLCDGPPRDVPFVEVWRLAVAHRGKDAPVRCG